MISPRALPFALLLGLTACAESMAAEPAANSQAVEPDTTTAPSQQPSPEPEAQDGGALAAPDAAGNGGADANLAPPVVLDVLTYNVAGLPQGVSGSDPAVNTPLISPLLEPFQLVLVQEDFTYHAQLVASVTHPYQSETVQLVDRSDGLNTLSRFPFTDFARTTWNECNGYFDQGSDCLTKKGFTRSVLDLGNGRLVDVYDVHFDAGRSAADQAARQHQADQLADAIEASSDGHAVLVAGDTNMRADDELTFSAFLTRTDLACACRTLSCPEAGRIDRILYRSGGGVTLTPLTYALEQGFVDDDGAPLSDHEAVGVRFEAR